MMFESLVPLDSTEKLFSYLNFYYICMGRHCFPNTFSKIETNNNSENKIIIYLLVTNKMKTLTLHTNCSQLSLRNEWCGIRMFSTIANPAQANLGKVDYISTQLEEASGW